MRSSDGPAAGPLGGCGDPLSMANTLRFQLLSNQEGQLEGLGCIETRVAMGVVAIGQSFLGDRLGAADALGDVLAGHLEMDTTGVRAFRAMHGEEALHLREDAIE